MAGTMRSRSRPCDEQKATTHKPSETAACLADHVLDAIAVRDVRHILADDGPTVQVCGSDRAWEQRQQVTKQGRQESRRSRLLQAEAQLMASACASDPQPATPRQAKLCVRTRGGVVRGSADDLHAALVSAVVRPRALEGGQEGVVDVWKDGRGCAQEGTG